MNNLTKNSFCLPIDQDSGKTSLKVFPEFHLVKGNLTDVPLPPHSTLWRTMPFHLCNMGMHHKEASAEIEIEGREPFTTHGDHFLFIPAGTTHRITESGSGPRRSLWIHFTAVFLGGFDLFSLCETSPIYLSEPDDVKLFRQFLTELISFPKNMNPWESLRFQITGIRLVGELMSRFPRKDLSQKMSDNIVRLQPALEMLNSSQKQPTTQELAQIACLSPSRFLAVFHETLSTSPGQYWKARRHALACEMILQDIPIGTIAEELGYADLFHFSRSFKKIEGISPRQYRQNNQNRTENNLDGIP